MVGSMLNKRIDRETAKTILFSILLFSGLTIVFVSEYSACGTNQLFNTLFVLNFLVYGLFYYLLNWPEPYYIFSVVTFVTAIAVAIGAQFGVIQCG